MSLVEENCAETISPLLRANCEAKTTIVKDLEVFVRQPGADKIHLLQKNSYILLVADTMLTYPLKSLIKNAPGRN